MKVLQIHNRYKFFGGEDVVVQKEHQLLVDNGVAVEQLFFNNDGVDAKKIFRNKKSEKRVIEKIISFRPDVVHVHNIFYDASPSILFAIKKIGVTTVMTLHNYRLLCPNALFLRNQKLCTKCQTLKFPLYAVKYSCFKDSRSKSLLLSSSLFYHNIIGTWTNNVDRFIVLTPFIKNLFLNSSLNLNPSKVIVKANSVDDLKVGRPFSNDREGFLFVGRISAEKGIDILIEAFNELKEYQLTIVGDGDLLPKLRKKAGDNINFRGKQEFSVIKDLLKKTKALIFPSFCYEGLPNTIIESFSSGTPVLASNIDNINKIVKNHHNGLLFETGDVKSLVETVKKFILSDKQGFYNQNARETYESNYTHAKNFEKLINVYTEIIQAKKLYGEV